MKFPAPPRLITCHPSWQWTARPLPDHDLWCVLGGRGTMQLGRRQWTVEPGHAFVFAPGDSPVGRHDSRQPLTVFFAHFTDPAWKRSRTLATKAWDPVLLDHLARAASRWARRADAAGHRGAVTCVRQILDLLGQTAPATHDGRFDSRIDAVADLVAEEPSRPWRIAELGQRVGLSPHYLSHLFREVRGQRLSDYLIEQRVRLAARMLADSRQSLGEIAEACGYEDVYYFNRQFRRVMGRPPGQWRQARLPRGSV